MPHLFTTFTLRDIRFRNRIVVSPMCQYSCEDEDGAATEWHLVHLGSRAVGGAGLVIAEATAVEPKGRISPQDLGIWNDEQAEALAPVAHFIKQHGAAAGIQLAHAGRKASTRRPWDGRGSIDEEEGGWRPVQAPSPIAYKEGYPLPEALDEDGIRQVVEQFAAAARRCREVGFDVVEIHAAHGYLLHEFLSPLTNERQDDYGGSFGNRTRLVREVAEAVRREWPERLPLLIRISATDWVEGGWDVEQSAALARQLEPLGVDLIDCSSGGIIPGVEVDKGPGYQTPLAAHVRRHSGLPTGAVGRITEPQQADHIIRTGQADMVLMAREFLREPYWPLRAARELGHDIIWPAQYRRAKR